MADVPELGAVARIDGALYECFAIGEGVTVYFRRIGASTCPTCGFPEGDRHFLLGSPQYRTEVEPVTTIPPG